LKIAVLGAECTGKSQLVKDLGLALQAQGHWVVCVPEYLRQWCEQNGRTPHAHEQAHIAQTQAANEDKAAQTDPNAILVADTTPLTTALYSELLFADTGLLTPAIERQRSYTLTLVCAADLPWMADGFQRDGIKHRQEYADLLEARLVQHQLPFERIDGLGEARTQRALQLVLRLLSRQILQKQ
jgi:HTH-type transcriptional regulator, transcriptional repressor of NAD biosynthesis genes